MTQLEAVMRMLDANARRERERMLRELDRHAHGTRNHRGHLPRAGRLLPAEPQSQDAKQPVK
jgi:hypothetical protein